MIPSAIRNLLFCSSMPPEKGTVFVVIMIE